MKGKRFFAVILSIIMIASMIPAANAADESIPDGAVLLDTGSDSFSVQNGIVLSKTAELQDDGSYSITLQAFATGVSAIIEKDVPLDIVMVLDVSGSMNYQVGNQVKYTAVGSSETAYTYDTYTKALYYKHSDGSFYKVSRGSSGGKYYLYYKANSIKYYLSPEGGTQESIPATGSQNATAYTGILYEQSKYYRIDALKDSASAFIDMVAAQNAQASAKDESFAGHRISLIKFASESLDTIGNDTFIAKDLDYVADGAIINYSQTVCHFSPVETGADSLKSVINGFIAGGTTRADYGLEHAAEELNYDVRENANRVVIFFTDGSPTYNTGFKPVTANAAIAEAKDIKAGGVPIYSIFFGNPKDSNINNINIFLDRVSSNYPEASSMTDSGERGEGNYFFSATDSAGLQAIFTSIATEIGSTEVTLDENAYVTDIIAPEFVLPADTGSTCGVKAYNCYADQDGNKYYKGSEDSSISLSVTCDPAAKAYTVTGFSYKDNYVAHARNIGDKGKLIEVIITGIRPTDALLAKEAPIYTNSSKSGIYDGNDKAVNLFPRPIAKIARKAVVVDYAKTVNVGTAELDYISSSPVYLREHLGGDTNTECITGGNGIITYSDSTVNYTITTMALEGYDHAALFGKTDVIVSTNRELHNQWSYISFVPANNIYFEDTFVTVKNDDGSVARAGIEYASNWNLGVQTEGSNSGSDTTDGYDGETGVAGWIDSIVDDTGAATDGSEHGGVVGAKASFTFNGTGFDIYSRTSGTSARVRVQIQAVSTDAEGNETVKTLALKYVDTRSAGDYWQVPALYWTAKERGTYRVNIAVLPDIANQETTRDSSKITYYLDGIRIYNPIDEYAYDADGEIITDDDGNETYDAVIEEAYGSEARASFISLRDLLIENYEGFDADTELSGVVFIDPTLNPKADTETDLTKDLANYVNNGPKNEIYLAPKQAIIFKLSPEVYAAKLSVGMKALTGSAATVEIPYGDGKATVNVSSSMDQYYTIEPNGQYVTISNTGSSLLSITKLKVSAPAAVSENSLYAMFIDTPVADVEEAYLMFEATEYVPYGGTVEEAADETAEGSEGGITEFDIYNPAEPDVDEGSYAEENNVADWVSSLFSGIRSIFD